MEWDLSAPLVNDLSDKSVVQVDDKLLGKRIALLITGSIAAYQTPDLVRLLRKNGAEVKVFCSIASLNFVTEKSLYWASNNAVCTEISTEVEHLGDESFDLYLVAPATYNTINKFSSGIADSIISTTLSSALGYLHLAKTKIVVCPTFHYSMHNEILIKSLRELKSYGVIISKPRQEDGKNKLPDLAILVDFVKQILNE